jgi:hypothetical protein
MSFRGFLLASGRRQLPSIRAFARPISRPRVWGVCRAAHRQISIGKRNQSLLHRAPPDANFRSSLRKDLRACAHDKQGFERPEPANWLQHWLTHSQSARLANANSRASNPTFRNTSRRGANVRTQNTARRERDRFTPLRRMGAGANNPYSSSPQCRRRADWCVASRSQMRNWLSRTWFAARSPSIS